MEVCVHSQYGHHNQGNKHIIHHFQKLPCVLIFFFVKTFNIKPILLPCFKVYNTVNYIHSVSRMYLELTTAR